METHKTKKHMTIKRVGTIASVGDVIKACTNRITMELTCWEMESSERPIAYQLVTNILRFMMSTRVKEWLANFASSQPQIGFVFFQGVKNVMVAIVGAAQNFNTLSAIDDEYYYHIQGHSYEEALQVLVAFKDEILCMVWANTYYTLMPMITPLEFNLNHRLFSSKRIRDEGYSQEAPAASSAFSGERSPPPFGGRGSGGGRHAGIGRGHGDHGGRGDERGE